MSDVSNVIVSEAQAARSPAWAVYFACPQNGHMGWLVDTGVGGTYAYTVASAQWFPTMSNALEVLIATDILPAGSTVRTARDRGFYIVRVQ